MPDYLGGNRLTLLKNGEQYFPALVAAIDAARAEVFLETYIYADDETGSLVTDALARAAARGVVLNAGTLPLEAFDAAADSRTRAVVLSSVQWSHGYRADLAAIVLIMLLLGLFSSTLARLEKPHIGNCAVPFMKSTTGWLSTSALMRSVTALTTLSNLGPDDVRAAGSG